MTKAIGIASAAFVVFSVIVAQGWLYKIDSGTQSISQEHSSRLLDVVLSFLSFIGSIEVTVAVLLVLLVVLFLRGHQLLAGRLLMVFVATGLLELAMKLYMPQHGPPPSEVAHTQYLASADNVSTSTVISSTYSYPSGHMLRGVILLGTLYCLSRSRFQRTVVILALMGVAIARIYFEAHWPSDVAGGALLGVVALLWAFNEKKDLKPPKDTNCEQDAPIPLVE